MWCTPRPTKTNYQTTDVQAHPTLISVQSGVKVLRVWLFLVIFNLKDKIGERRSEENLLGGWTLVTTPRCAIVQLIVCENTHYVILTTQLSSSHAAAYALQKGYHMNCGSMSCKAPLHIWIWWIIFSLILKEFIYHAISCISADIHTLAPSGVEVIHLLPNKHLFTGR